MALRFISIYLATLVSFTLIFALVDSFSQYSSLMENSSGFGEFLKTWFLFYAAQVPIFFSRALGPVITAASAAFTVTFFLRANEFTPILGAGISLQRQIAPVVVLSVLTALGNGLVQEIWIPANRGWMREARGKGRGRDHIRHASYYDQKRRLLAVFRYYWLRKFQGDGFLLFSLQGFKGNRFILEAREARWFESKKEKYWILENGFIQEYDGTGELILHPKSPDDASDPQGKNLRGNGLQRTFEKVRLDELVETDMIPQDLQTRQSMEAFLWLGEILEKIERSPSATRWWVRFYGRIVDPIHSIILVLLGIPAIFLWGTRNIFLSAITVIVTSSIYFVAYLVLLNMGNRGVLSPGLAAGLAPVFFGALGITMYWKMRS